MDQAWINIRNSASLNTFKKKLLNFIRPCANNIFDIHNPLGIKLLKRLRLGFSYFHEHRFRHCFKIIWILCANVAKILNQQCISFSTAPTFSFLGKPFFRKLGPLMITYHCESFRLSQSETQLTQTFLYGNQNYHCSINRLVIKSIIEYLMSTERFKC